MIDRKKAAILAELSVMLAAIFWGTNYAAFHIGPTVLRRRFLPGLITAVGLFVPVGACAFVGAYFDGALTARAVVISALGGALLMAYPFVLFKVRARLPSYDE